MTTNSDPTGNKKFKCTVCPYRSNWKADMFRHLRKRHYLENPQLENLLILDTELAASSIQEYERIFGINVKKRSWVDSELSENETLKKPREDNSTQKLPVSVAELNVKPYKCVKCGFR